MPYILNKTNGTKLAILQDASLDLTTSLTFVGRNYSGYGEIVNENFIKLLENFSNSTPPPRPVMGQVWFDSTNKRLNFCYDGRSFKGISSIHVQPTSPSSSIEGDLWWDSTNDQLKAYDGSSFQVIGPQLSVAARSSWEYAEEKSQEDETLNIPVIKGKIGSIPIVTISKETFTPIQSSDLYSGFDIISKGITLSGADPVTGSSKESGYYFWGTAAEALLASTSTVATTVEVTATEAAGPFYLTFANTPTGTSALGTDIDLSYDASTNVLATVASSARYADLAERYAADAIYDAGTVLVIGGDKEVTVTSQYANPAAIGIVSKDPAYRMNSAAGSDDTHPYIALKGRVPCKVVGPIEKGSLLVTSNILGHAAAWSENSPMGSVIGKALENYPKGLGVIEVLVV